jgi:hypothetical protein
LRRLQVLLEAILQHRTSSNYSIWNYDEAIARDFSSV